MSSEAIRELPDIETLVVHHLQADEALRGAGLRQVAGPDPPANPKYPLAHVVRFGGVAPIPFWLDGALVEVNLWAAHGTTGLRLLGAKVFVSLQKLVGVHAEGIVTGVEEVGGRAFLRDGASQRPRFRIGIRVFAHPHRS